MIPPLSQDVFKNVLSALSVNHVTCVFEADDQIAALANAWGCPVMSNDSDFFIYDLVGGFIVFDYVNLQVRSSKSESQVRKEDNNSNNVDVSVSSQRKGAHGSKSESSTGKIEGLEFGSKNSSSHDGAASSPTSEEKCNKNGASGQGCQGYKYLAVQIYFTQTLVDTFPSLEKSMLPLFACLYGNDVVNRQHFEVFYTKCRFPALSSLPRVWSSPGKKHETILKLLLWLDGVESRDKALEAVVRHMAADKKVNVEKLRDLLSSVIESYFIQKGYLQSYFETGDLKWLETETEVKNGVAKVTAPLWFLTGVCKAQIATFVLNAHLLRRALLRCQMEDLKAPSGHRCALPLRLIAYSIVCCKKAGNSRETPGDHTQTRGYVTEYDREGKDYRSSKWNLASCLSSGRGIPSLDETPTMPRDDKLSFLLEAFGVESAGCETLRPKLVFIVVVLVYWVKNASPRVNELHLLSLLTCMLKIGIDQYLQDENEGPSTCSDDKSSSAVSGADVDQCARDGSEDARIPDAANSFANTESQNARGRKTNDESDAGGHHFLHELLDTCPTDVLKDAQRHLSRFCAEPSSSSQFYVQNVHAVAQFQSVYLAALHLNSVLQDVIPPPCPSQVLNGRFAYNLYRELHSRTNPRLYLAQLLGRETPLVGVMDQLTEMVSRFLPEGSIDAPPSGIGKKHRKRKQQQQKTCAAESRDSAQEDRAANENLEHLAGNKFALLVIRDT